MEGITIKKASELSGLSVKTIRFYEGEGVLPEPSRTAAGYRIYGQQDIRKLRLAHQARLLGLPLAETRSLIDHAFSATCGELGDQLLEVIGRRRSELERRLAELVTAARDLDDLEEHVRHACVVPEQCIDSCDFCPIIDEGRR